MQRIAHTIPDTLNITTTLTFQVTIAERRSNAETTPTDGYPVSLLSVRSIDFFPTYADIESVHFENIHDRIEANPLPANLISQLESLALSSDDNTYYIIPPWAQFGDSQVTVAFSGTSRLEPFVDGPLRRLRPASSLILRFPSCNLIPFSIALPPPLTSSFACLTLLVELDEFRAKFDQAKQMVEEFKDGPDRSCTPISKFVLDTQRDLAARLDTIRSLTQTQLATYEEDDPSQLEPKRQIGALAGELRDYSNLSLKRVSTQLEIAPGWRPEELEILIDDTIDALAKPVEVSILVDPRSTDARKIWGTREAADVVSLKEVEIPFTTESESGLHGTRSAISLTALGGLLLLMSTINLSPIIGFVNRMTPRQIQLSTEHTRVPSIDPDSFVAYTSAIVAVLVLFPMGLYFQFLQRRSRSELGNQAQSTLLTVLTMLYMLPILPAGLTASGRSSATIAVACLAAGLAAVASSIVLRSVYSTKSLEVSRLNILRPPRRRFDKPRGKI